MSVQKIDAWKDMHIATCSIPSRRAVSVSERACAGAAECLNTYIHIYIHIVRTQEKACSSDSRFGRKLSGTTGHRLLGTQGPQMLCVAAWVWFCLTTEFVEIYIYAYR